MRVALRVTPGAARTAIRGLERDAAGTVRVALRVAAPPDGGRANAEAIRFLTRRWRLPPTSVRLVAGARARNKTLAIDGPPDALIARLRAAEGEDG